MALKYKMQERMKSMSSALGGVFTNGTKPVLRLSELKAVAYGGRGSVDAEIRFLRNSAGAPAPGVEEKLSDVVLDYYTETAFGSKRAFETRHLEYSGINVR